MINLVTLVGTSLPRLCSRFYPDILWRVPTSDRAAYLTFDDGPNPAITNRMMAVLARYDAAGTFFLIGRNAESNPQLVTDLRAAGHTVGNHTYTHPDAWRVPAATALRELERTTDLLQDLSGERLAWMRPPYGHFTRSMREWCRSNRQQITMWDVGPGDFLSFVSREEVQRHVEAYLRPGSIIVLHDNPRCAQDTPIVLDRLLARLTADGWRFPPMPDHPYQG